MSRDCEARPMGDESPIAQTNQRRASDSAGRYWRLSELKERGKSSPDANLRCPIDRSSPADSPSLQQHHGLPDAGGQLRTRACQAAALRKSRGARARTALQAGAGALVAVHPCVEGSDPLYPPRVP